MILDRFRLDGQGRDRHRRAARASGAASRSGSPRRAPTSCWPRARRPTSTRSADADRGAGRRGLAVPTDVMRPPRTATGSSRPRVERVRPARRAGQQRRRHACRGPAMQTERALLRDGAALQRDVAVPADASWRRGDGRHRRSGRDRQHLVAVAATWCRRASSPYGAGKAALEHDDAQPRAPSWRPRCGSTPSRVGGVATESLDVVLTDDACAPSSRRTRRCAARRGRGHRLRGRSTSPRRRRLGHRQGRSRSTAAPSAPSDRRTGAPSPRRRDSP